MEKRLEKLRTWPTDLRECSAWRRLWLPCSPVLCLQLSSTQLPTTCTRTHIVWLPSTTAITETKVPKPKSTPTPTPKAKAAKGK
jgi:hypothetical protein